MVLRLVGPAYSPASATWSGRTRTFARHAGRTRVNGGCSAGHALLSTGGAEGRPVTIRSHAGELAILDGGFPEFRENPAEAWEPCPEGAEGEFRSRREYPGRDRVAGNFADNTVLLAESGGWRTAAESWGGHTRGTRRRVFNNAFVQVEGPCALAFPPAADDFQADGNLHWSLKPGPSAKGDPIEAFRRSAAFEATKKAYAPG